MSLKLSIRIYAFAATALTLFFIQRAEALCDEYHPCAPTDNSIVFRELILSEGYGFDLGFLKIRIPGWDHVGFALNGTVYESHEGYPTGTYTDSSFAQVQMITHRSGPQHQHTRGTFFHDAQVDQATPVKDIDEFPFDPNFLQRMATFAEMAEASGATYIKFRFTFNKDQIFRLDRHPIEFTNPFEMVTSEYQKGAKNQFTCSGLVEAAAEWAGVNDGIGFLRNDWEHLPVYIPVSVGGLAALAPEFGMRNVSMLLPQRIHESLVGGLVVKHPLGALKQYLGWIGGIIDPVDYIITDPLGRRMGHTPLLGEVNEIPRSGFKGRGDLEQFFVQNPVPGMYAIELIGTGGPVRVAIGTDASSFAIDGFLKPGHVVSSGFYIPLDKYSPGDLNGDAVLDVLDIFELNMRLNTALTDYNDPADVNRDGSINEADLDALNYLIYSGQTNASMVCQTSSVDNNKNFRKAGATLQRLMKKVKSLLRQTKARRRSKIKMNALREQIDIFTVALNPSCAIFPETSYNCGRFLPPRCYQYSLEPAVSACRENISALQALAKKLLKQLRASGASHTIVSTLLIELRRTRRDFKKISAATKDLSVTRCDIKP